MDWLWGVLVADGHPNRNIEYVTRIPLNLNQQFQRRLGRIESSDPTLQSLMICDDSVSDYDLLAAALSKNKSLQSLVVCLSRHSLTLTEFSLLCGGLQRLSSTLLTLSFQGTSLQSGRLFYLSTCLGELKCLQSLTLSNCSLQDADLTLLNQVLSQGSSSRQPNLYNTLSKLELERNSLHDGEQLALFLDNFQSLDNLSMELRSSDMRETHSLGSFLETLVWKQSPILQSLQKLILFLKVPTPEDDGLDCPPLLFRPFERLHHLQVTCCTWRSGMSPARNYPPKSPTTTFSFPPLLESLNLSRCYLGDQQILRLVESLEQDVEPQYPSSWKLLPSPPTRLKALNLSSNHIGVSGALRLLQATDLTQRLELNHNRIQDFTELVSAMATNITLLEKLEVTNNIAPFAIFLPLHFWIYLSMTGVRTLLANETPCLDDGRLSKEWALALLPIIRRPGFLFYALVNKPELCRVLLTRDPSSSLDFRHEIPVPKE